MNYPDKVVSMKLPNGKEIKVEATNLGGETRVGVAEVFDFEDVTNAIEAIAASVTTTFDKVKPKKASVEFGVKMALPTPWGKLYQKLQYLSRGVKVRIKIYSVFIKTNPAP